MRLTTQGWWWSTTKATTETKTGAKAATGGTRTKTKTAKPTETERRQRRQRGRRGRRDEADDGDGGGGGDENQDGNDGDDSVAWTEASYKGETLLRQTAWIVLDDDCQCEYGYSDTWQPISTSPKLRSIVREITDFVFGSDGEDDDNDGHATMTTAINCCNMNYYPRGGGVGFHADDEFLFDGLNQSTAILSLSLCRHDGEHSDGDGSRLFQVKSKAGWSEDQDDVEAPVPKDGNKDLTATKSVTLGQIGRAHV